MILNATSAQLIEKVIQQLLRLDPDAKEKLTELNGKLINVQLTDLNMDYFFRIEDNQISVNSESDQAAQVKMQGSSFAFFNMSLSERGGDAIFKGEIHFEGEVGTAQKFQQFWQSLSIDWEEELSRYTGDAIAHQFGNFARGFHGQAKKLWSTAQQNLSEYIQEEARMSPTSVETNHFFEHLADLKSDLNRLEARINKLDRAPLDSSPLAPNKPDPDR